jgi:hypothetical protein
MRKYRLTKITVKTREIISMSKETSDSTCPVCHQPLSALRPAAESSAVLPKTEKRTAELPPADLAEIDKQKN